MNWVSVEEKLPPKNDEYLVTEKDNNISVLTADFRDGDWFTVRSFGVDCEEYQLFCVTHWMPLPDPPSAKPVEDSAKHAPQLSSSLNMASGLVPPPVSSDLAPNREGIGALVGEVEHPPHQHDLPGGGVCSDPYHRTTSIYCLQCLPSDAPLGALLLSNCKPTALEIERGLEIAKLLKVRADSLPQKDSK